MKRRKNSIQFLQAVLFLVFIASAGAILKEMVIEPEQNRQMAQQLKEEFPEGTSPGDSSSEGEPKQAGEESRILPLDFLAMQKKYPEIQGWLTIPGTNIDYPVLQSSEDDQEYYLKHNYRGEWDANGSLFLQWNCEVSKSQNLVIYGHNMNSGAMFGNLDRFTEEDYWSEHKSVFFQTASGISEYEIVSVMKTDLSIFPFQQVEFAGAGSLKAYVEQAKSCGLFEIREFCGTLAHVLTLVTCSYEWEDARNVVVAVQKG